LRLHEFRDGEIGRYRYEEMDMIFRNRTFYDLYIPGLAYLSYKIPQSFRHLSVQHLLSIFGNPDQVVFKVIYGMGGSSIILHIPIVLKSSPKGEGFSPRGRH